jgi:hypothetical protein
VLLSPRDESQAVRVLCLAFCEEVHVIGHVTVRAQCDVLFGRSALNLRTNKGDCVVSDEASSTRVSAERQEILSGTEVVEPFDVFRPASEHALVMATSDPCQSA